MSTLCKDPAQRLELGETSNPAAHFAFTSKQNSSSWSRK